MTIHTAAIAFGLLACAVPIAADAPAPADGHALFEVCAACHGANGEGTDLGPDLRGVVGRKAAALDDFAFSGALRRSGKVWTEAEVAAFLRNPQGAVPGTRMAYPGTANAEEAAALATYLSGLR